MNNLSVAYLYNVTGFIVGPQERQRLFNATFPATGLRHPGELQRVVWKWLGIRLLLDRNYIEYVSAIVSGSLEVTCCGALIISYDLVELPLPMTT